MTTGFQNSSGVDLDNIFASGSGGAVTGFQLSNGSDLNARYATYTNSQAAGTGLQLSNGNDLNTRFQKLAGTTAASVAVSPNGGTFSRGSQTSSGTLSQAFTAAASNGVGPFTYAWTRTSGTTLTSSGTSTATLTLSRAYAKGSSGSYVEGWTVVVTDTGNGNMTASAMITVDFEIANSA